MATIGASIDPIEGTSKDKVRIARVHKDSKSFNLTQRMFPVSAVGGAAKHARETTLFAGVITADGGKHIG